MRDRALHGRVGIEKRAFITDLDGELRLEDLWNEVSVHLGHEGLDREIDGGAGLTPFARTAADSIGSRAHAKPPGKGTFMGCPDPSCFRDEGKDSWTWNQ